MIQYNQMAYAIEKLLIQLELSLTHGVPRLDSSSLHSDDPHTARNKREHQLSMALSRDCWGQKVSVSPACFAAPGTHSASPVKHFLV